MTLKVDQGHWRWHSSIGHTSLSISGHRLRGSASTVLTATSQVNGRWRILTPHRVETHEPTATKFRTIDYVRERTLQPNLVQIHPLGASGHMGEI